MLAGWLQGLDTAVPEYYRPELVGLPGVVFTRICPLVYQAEQINGDELIQLQCKCTVCWCNFIKN